MEKISFDKIWELLNTHGVIPDKRVDASNLWATYTPEQQHQLYATISSKIRLRKFVHYDPVRALWENAQTSITRIEPPTNYAGKPMPRGGEFYLAEYNGQRGLYKVEDVKAHNMLNPQKFEI